MVGVVGDYSFQFLIEELAVAAQYKIPFVMILINNAYLGLIRQAEKGYKMDYEVQLSFNNINWPGNRRVRRRPRQGGGSVGLHGASACSTRADRATIQDARSMAKEKRVPVVVEVITERVTNIAMGPEIDKITEFEEIDRRRRRPKRFLGIS